MAVSSGAVSAASSIDRDGHTVGHMSDTSVLLIAEIHGLVGREVELRALLEDLAASARRDTGCLSYHVAAALGEPGELLVVAQWRDEAALRVHYATDGYRAYRSAVGELLARPSDVVVHHVATTIHARAPTPPARGLFGCRAPGRAPGRGVYGRDEPARRRGCRRSSEPRSPAMAVTAEAHAIQPFR